MWKRIRSKRQPQQSTAGANEDKPGSSAVENHSPDLPGFRFPDKRRSASTIDLPDDARPSVSSLPTGRRLSDRSETPTFQNQILSTNSLHHQRRRSQDRRDDPMGLTVLHSPTSTHPSVDIVFIHGLGGTSLRTWCKTRDLENLWPQNWLPQEPELANARILTFGYHSHFASKKQQASLTINDFSNDLLFRLKYDDARLGDVPVIIVAHSLGGLVFKKAFIHGNLNEEYKEVTSRIRAVLFLATPHRGTDLAETLNRVLTSSVFGHSQKEYVNELARKSPTIDEINESFRHHARKLQIFSFYETVATSVGPLTMMILDKTSSVLGYENEIHQALIANHHDVCKFSNPQDSNYRAVCGALKSVVANINGDITSSGDEDGDFCVLRPWLGVTGPPEEDLALLHAVRRPGTCQSLLQTAEFTNWVESDGPSILWTHAPPGNGKSVHCSSVVEKLTEEGAKVVYWFFKYEDANKRSLGNMLRSVAYQIASNNPDFRRELADLARSGTQVIRAEATAVWRIIFEPRLRLIDKLHYWVVDGLDESDCSKTFVDLISRTGRVDNGLRTIIFSRPLSPISQAFRRARKLVPVSEIPLSNELVDIRLVAADEMEYFISDNDDLKTEIIDEIASRSQGNFLWATLVLSRIVHCLRPEDIRTILRETPDGMDKLYGRMAESIARLGRPADKELCRILLSWAVYSQRPVSIHELKGPYKSQLHSIIDVRHTIDQVCGQFVSVDQKENISLVHQTARDYLRTTDSLPFSLDPEGAHDEMVCLCLQSLCDTSLRGKIRLRKTPPFLDYASSSWAFHLDQCSVGSDAVLDMLSYFFSDIYPMVWIQLLSINGNLSLLVSASSSLARYARARRRADAIKSPTLWRIEDLALLETWATDFLKITAKYGSHLTDDPDSIFYCIPPFSPQSSVIFRTYSNKTANAISITGVSNVDWDDCLARVAVASDKARHVAVSPQYLAVANDSPSGRIQMWDTVIFQEYRMLETGEPICAITFSQSGSLLACYGLDTTYVWNVSNGKIVVTAPNPFREKAIALRFAPRECRIIITTDLRRVYQLALDDASAIWSELDPTLLEESSLPEDAFINSPSSVSFNVDCSQLAVAYRGFPLAVWGLDPPELIARCRRRHKQGQTMNNTWTGVNRVAWHPFTGHVLGIYRDGNIFKWGPMADSHEEVKQELDATPSEISCSPNGQVFATSDVKGTVKIYDYAQMVLIYRLTSEDLITAITFSPDSGRFYDIRGASCNAWEPNCLVRLVDKSLSGSEKSESVTTSDMDWSRQGSIASEGDDVRSTTMSLAASEAHAESRAPLTAVSTCRENPMIIAYSNSEGTVVVKDLARDCGYEASRSPFGMGVGHVALSHEGKRLAYSTLNGRVTVKDLDLESAVTREQMRVIYSEKASIQRGIIRQLLFQAGGHLLLVGGTERVHVLSMPSGTITASLDTSGHQGIRHELWSVHLNNPEKLLAFNSDGARECSWQDLKPPVIPKIIHDDEDASLETQHNSAVESLQPSFHPQMSLVVTFTEEMGSKKFSFAVFQQAMEDLQPNGDTSVREILIPPRLSRRIMRPVGILHDGRLVFLDTYLWVCTLPLQSIENQTAPTRHFFIPRDWVNNSGINLCSMLKDGTILCPSRGELAAIRNDIAVGW